MVKFIPILYGNKGYQHEIKPKIKEVPAHFDSKPKIPSNFNYSLHTEYSYYPRKFTSPACKGLVKIKRTDKRGVPKLWFDEEWVRDFIVFIFRLVGEKKPPKIIEIHPPFNDYCKDLSHFIDLYEKFEREISDRYPDVQILIENRYGTQYHTGNFVLSTTYDLKKLAKLIETRELKLRIALDIPQLFSAHSIEIGKFSKERISQIFKELYPIREYIMSIHLWGKCLGKNKRPTSHVGTLDSYFGGLKCKELSKGNLQDQVREIKVHFLRELHDLLNDGLVRYFVPEVNSSTHLHSIVKDLISFGFEFI